MLIELSKAVGNRNGSRFLIVWCSRKPVRQRRMGPEACERIGFGSKAHVNLVKVLRLYVAHILVDRVLLTSSRWELGVKLGNRTLLSIFKSIYPIQHTVFINLRFLNLKGSNHNPKRVIKFVSVCKIRDKSQYAIMEFTKANTRATSPETPSSYLYRRWVQCPITLRRNY